MNKEDLKKLGITDEEVIKQIIVLHGKDIESHKAEVAQAGSQMTALQGQLTAANQTIEGFKKMDVDGIKKAADEWKAKAEQAQAEAQKQISGLKFEHALSGALSSAKARNQKAVRALLDAEAMKLGEDGQIIGLKEQLEKIRTDNDFLFEPETPAEKPPRIVSGGGDKKTVVSDSVVDAARKAAGLA